MFYTVAVRALCEFTAKQGDLDLRFTPSPTAQEGMAGHTAVAARRGAAYETEITLAGSHGRLLVRGRADGYDPASNRLEEVKTHRGDLARQPAHHRHLHWAQAKTYAWLLCEARGLPAIDVALVYFDITRQQETVLCETHTAEALGQFFEAQCARFLHWAEQEMVHRGARDAALATLVFPHADFRAGQRPLAEAVYRSQRSGRCLMVQAPTGIGKTVGTLFPALKACPPQGTQPGLDKLLFLTAKTSGRQVALDALATLGASSPDPLPLRVLELVARDKACEHPDKACHGESCPLAKGFYDRLPAARAAAAGTPRAWDKAALRSLALAHGICPYYLGQELARWSDVVVGDVNYWFDTSALLYALASDGEWRTGVLVDEAHNLVERARGMYSATLDPQALRAARRAAPDALRRPLDRLRRAWEKLQPEAPLPFRAHEAVPGAFAMALQQAATAIGDYLAEQPGEADGPLQRFWFDALHFGRLAEAFGEHSLFDATLEDAVPGIGGAPAALLCIRNVVPAPFLRPRFAAAHAVTLFSATLRPEQFHRDMLGLPAATASIDVPSPFTAGQLRVRVARHISTRWRDRAASLAPIAELMAGQYRTAPGNYLAFFSSFDYLRDAADLLRDRHPDIAQWEQSRGMDESAREDFLRRFAPTGQGIGFAVLGGAFGEGIDLTGDRLVGAFIATLGLPQVNPVNERMRERMEKAFGAGYDYAYFYPGLQKVVQAAGRVIRTTTDRGTVCLMDDRFDRPEARRLLPAWWAIEA
ncbi:MAG: ATP-dependent DNA helicase [Pseudomonadota bacterium]